MATFKKILTAYDGSPQSKTALDWAMMLNTAVGAELEVIKVFEPIALNYIADTSDISERYAEMERGDFRMMEDVKSVCKDICRANVHVDILRGNVALALLDYARENGFDLIVSGTKGHGVLAEMLMGSVTHSLVSLSKMPVLVVKEPMGPPTLKKILVAYDGSEFAKAALNGAVDLGMAMGAGVMAVKVTDPRDVLIALNLAESGSELEQRAKQDELAEADKRYLEEAKSAAALRGMAIGAALLPSGNIATTLIHFAEGNDVDLIVTGTQGHGLLDELLMGSVTRNLLSLSKIPVLVVKM